MKTRGRPIVFLHVSVLESLGSNLSLQVKKKGMVFHREATDVTFDPADLSPEEPGGTFIFR